MPSSSEPVAIGDLLAGTAERLERINVLRKQRMAEVEAGERQPFQDPYLGDKPTTEELLRNVRSLPAVFKDARLHHVSDETIVEWAAHPEGILLVTGPTGRGKTYAACAAAFAFATRQRKNEVCFTSAANLVEGSFPDMDAKALLFQSRRFAVLDDLGAEHVSDLAMSKLARLVDARWRNAEALPVIITTNLSLEKLMAGYPEAMMSRILSESSTFVEMRGEDLRLVPPEPVEPTDEELFT